MKKIILSVLVIVLGLSAKAQFTNNQSGASKTTLWHSNGGFQGDSGYVVSRIDTSGLTQISYYNGIGTRGMALVSFGNYLYYKNQNRWNRLLSDSADQCISSLTNATKINTVDVFDYTQTWRFNTLAGATGLSISSTSTAAASNLQKLLTLSLTGVNSNSNQTTFAFDATNNHSGTGSSNYTIIGRVDNGVVFNVGVAGSAGSTLGTTSIQEFKSLGVYGTSIATQGTGIFGNAYVGVSGYSSSNIGVLAVNGTGSTSYPAIAAALYAKSSSGYSIIVPSGGGNIGLGTITPGSLLTVVGNSASYAADISNANNIGVFASGTSGAGLSAQSISGAAIEGIVIPSSTNTTVALMKLTRGTSGTADVNIAGSIDTYIETSDGTNQIASQFISQWATATTGSRTSSVKITGVNSTTSTDLLTLAPVTTGIGASVASSTVTSGTILDITSTSTALAANNEGLNISMSGANGTNDITATGARISVTNTNGTSGTNVGLDIIASGATTANKSITATGDVDVTSSLISEISPSLGVTQTDTKGILLTNTTAAANNAQQISPSLRWHANGYKTSVTTGSTNVDFRAYVLPIQQVNNFPNGKWILENAYGGTGYTERFAVDNLGGIYFSGSAGTSSYILKSNGAFSPPTWVDPTSISLPYWALTGTSALTGGTIINTDGNILDIQSSGSNMIRWGTTITIGDPDAGDAGTVFVVDQPNKKGYFDDTNHDSKFGINTNNPAVALDIFGGALVVRDGDGDYLNVSTTTGNASIGDIGGSFNGDNIQITQGDGIIYTANAGTHNFAAGAVTIVDLAGTGSRTVLADASGVLSAPVSDITTKQFIQGLNNGTDMVMKLRPVSFQYREEFKRYGNGVQVGFIAQEIAQVLPNSVYTNFSNGKMGYNEIDLVPITVRALQEQILKTKSLEARIERLEAIVKQ